MNCDYVAFEGIDGSGKSSIIEQLSKILDENKIENKIVREPGGTKVGEGIRELLLSHDYKVDPLTEALLFCCLLYTSPSPRDSNLSRMPSSA